MKIELNELTIREVAENYIDNAAEGVSGYGGRLDIRPKYQREFVYNNAKRNAVIDTIRKGFPLNVMYWVVNGDKYEVLDGQQRTISFCQYVDGIFSVDNYFFGNLTKDEQEQILNYKLMIYFCEGNDREKLDWFEIINIAGERLTPQELRNAVYTGEWLTDAKSYFSRKGCAASGLAQRYVSGSAIRQEMLEVALKWINKGDICGYMAKHQHDTNADELWNYFIGVIEWVEDTFIEYRSEMKGLDWGGFYDVYHDNVYDTAELEREIKALMADDDIRNKKGIYIYVLSRDTKTLNLRAFSESQKRGAYERQNGVCVRCGKHFAFDKMEGDHITPWSKGGKTDTDNCQMLCQSCNRRKSDT